MTPTVLEIAYRRVESERCGPSPHAPSPCWEPKDILLPLRGNKWMCLKEKAISVCCAISKLILYYRGLKFLYNLCFDWYWDARPVYLLWWLSHLWSHLCHYYLKQHYLIWHNKSGWVNCGIYSVKGDYYYCAHKNARLTHKSEPDLY